MFSHVFVDGMLLKARASQPRSSKGRGQEKGATRQGREGKSNTTDCSLAHCASWPDTAIGFVFCVLGEAQGSKSGGPEMKPEKSEDGRNCFLTFSVVRCFEL